MMQVRFVGALVLAVALCGAATPVAMGSPLRPGPAGVRSAADTFPGPVTAITVDQAGDSVTITWSSPAVGSPFTGYVLELDGTGPIVVPAEPRVHTFDGLAVGKHTVTVAAVNEAGTGLGSIRTFTVVDLPGPPLNVAVMQTEPGVTVSWAAPLGPDVPESYLVQYDGGAPVSVPAETTSYIFGSVPVGNRTFSVTAVNAAGASAAVTKQLAVVAKPGTPGGLSVVQYLDAVIISWSAPTTGGPPRAYNVMSDVGDTQTILADNLSKEFGNMPPGNRVFTVTALNEAGWGPPASVPLTVVAPPGAPGDLKAVQAGTGIQVNWTAPVTGGPPQSYALSLDGGTPVVLGAGARAHTFAGVALGEHTVGLTATNVAGTSPSSTTSVTVSPLPPPPPEVRPGPPRSVSAKPGPRGRPLTVRVAWASPATGSPPTGYRVLALRMKDGKVVKRRGFDVSPGRAAVKLRLADARWRFQVRAVNGAGAGSWSARTRAVRPR